MGRVRRREMERLFSWDEAMDAGGGPLSRQYWISGGTIYFSEELFASGTRPLTEPETFLSFARLAARRKPPEDSILKWVRQHGLLYSVDPEGYLGYAGDDTSKRFVVNQQPTSVKEFQKEACHAYKLLDLFELWRGKEVRDGTPVDELRRRTTVRRTVSPPELGGGVYEWVYVAGENSGLQPPGEDKTDDDVLFQCQAAVKKAIEPYLLGMRFVFGSRGRLAMVCPNLIAAMYLQFAALVDGKRPTQICPGCNQVFEQTRSNKRYCNDTCSKRARRKPAQEK